MFGELENCTSLVSESLADRTNGFRKAAHLLCKYAINYPLHSNNTTVESYFHKRCCQEALVTKLCGDFVKKFLPVKFSLDCATNVPDVYTYGVLVLCMLLGIPANLLVICCIVVRRCLPKQTGYFLSSLAAGDIGVSISVPIHLIYQTNSADVPPRVNRFLIPSMHVFFASVSLLQISVVSVDRALAVTKPLLYPKIITIQRAKYTTIAVWLLSGLNFLFSILRIFVRSHTYIQLIFYFHMITLLIAPMFVVLISYVMVAVCACKHMKQERKRCKMIALLHPRRQSSMSATRYKELRISFNIVIMVIPFLGCWGFFTFAQLYETWTEYRFKGLANWVIIHLPSIMCSINPVLFLLLTRSLRKVFFSFLRKAIRAVTSKKGTG